MFFVAPFVHREIDHPQTTEFVFVAQSQLRTHFETQFAELFAGFQGIGTAENQYQIAGFGLHGGFQLLQHILRVEFIDTRFHVAVGFYAGVNHTFGTDLRPFHKFGQCVELLAGVRCGTFGTNAADVGRFVEHTEAVPFQHVHQFHKTHVETCVGFIAAVEFHGVVPSHARQFGQVDAFYGLEQMAAHAFEHIQNVFLFDERHFAVYLRKFGLTVGTQIFVAETFHNLEIAVESADHQQLFQCLRTLRQSVELPLIHAARHHKIARAFGRGVDQYGRFHLQKSLFVEIAAHLESHFVAQFEIFAHARTPQVEVTIFHAQVVAAVGLVFDGERRRGSLVQHVQFGNDDFDIARGHIGIFAVALGHCTGYLNNVFAPEVICFLT